MDYIGKETVYIIADIEADGLLFKNEKSRELTKLHVMSYVQGTFDTLMESPIQSTFSLEETCKVLSQENVVIVGHNFINYDIPAIQKLRPSFSIHKSSTVLCTYYLSNYLFPYGGFKHGLEEWGVRTGVPKVEVTDWINISPELARERCETDVHINRDVFFILIKYLKKLYQGEGLDINHPLRFLKEKAESLRVMEENGIPFDKYLALSKKEEFEFLLEEKKIVISAEMPKKVQKERYKSIYKKDGTLSQSGIKWKEMTEEAGIPFESEAIYQLGNPGSSLQVKEWFFSLGWKPTTFKPNTAKGKEGEKVPQIKDGTELCASVLLLAEKAPIIKEFEDYSILVHRIGVYKGFLEMERNGKLFMSCAAITKTGRRRHKKPFANMPKPKKKYAEDIRRCLIVGDETKIGIGSDLSGLEVFTGDHYRFEYDPDYVSEKNVEGFDPHLDISLLAGNMTQGDADFYTNFDSDADNTIEDTLRYGRLDNIRWGDKQVNFACTYGAGARKVSEMLGKSLKEGRRLHTTYWRRNWSTNEVSKNAYVRIVEGQEWVWNPVARMFFFLKMKKDVFSALNQSTASYFFDVWKTFCQKGLKEINSPILFDYHDELFFITNKSTETEAKEILEKSLIKANKILALNVEIRYSLKTGKDYGECH